MSLLISWSTVVFVSSFWARYLGSSLVVNSVSGVCNSITFFWALFSNWFNFFFSSSWLFWFSRIRRLLSFSRSTSFLFSSFNVSVLFFSSFSFFCLLFMISTCLLSSTISSSSVFLPVSFKYKSIFSANFDLSKLVAKLTYLILLRCFSIQ